MEYTKKALEAFNQAINCRPKDSAAYIGKGKVEIETGMIEEGLKQHNFFSLTLDKKKKIVLILNN